MFDGQVVRYLKLLELDGHLAGDVVPFFQWVAEAVEVAAEEEFGASGVDVDAVGSDVIAVDPASGGLCAIGEQGDGVAVLSCHFVEGNPSAGASEVGGSKFIGIVTPRLSGLFADELADDFAVCVHFVVWLLSVECGGRSFESADVFGGES